MTSENSAELRASWVKACTLCADKSDSDAFPEEAAIQSWFCRDKPRNLRPNANIGPKIKGTIKRTKPVSFGEVQSIMINPPDIISIFRSIQLAEDPITDKINVVSVVMRLRTSPVINFSKYAGDMPIMRTKMALRKSATTRSPRRVTT